MKKLPPLLPAEGALAVESRSLAGLAEPLGEARVAQGAAFGSAFRKLPAGSRPLQPVVDSREPSSPQGKLRDPGGVALALRRGDESLGADRTPRRACGGGSRGEQGLPGRPPAAQTSPAGSQLRQLASATRKESMPPSRAELADIRAWPQASPLRACVRSRFTSAEGKRTKRTT
jgi:hypothetical protein